MPINDNISKVIDVDINEILPNRFQPRRQFDEDEILELSDSIREHGIIQPIVVRTVGDKYEIIAGERRYKASVLAGLETVPVIVKNLNDKDSAEIALIENIQRKNLTPIEEALSYKQILDMGYLTQENLATKLGKSQSAVANKIRLLNLSDEVQEALLESKISERHARSLLRLSGEEAQNKMLDRIINERLTVRKTDEEIDKLKNGLENPIKIKEEKEEESMNNNINMMPNMTSTQDTQSSFKFFDNTPVQPVEQSSVEPVSTLNMGNVQPTTSEFDIFANTSTPSINIPDVAVESPQIQTPTFDFNNIQPIMEQPQMGNNEVNSLQSTPEPVQPSSIGTPTFDMGNQQSQGFDMFASVPTPSINIPDVAVEPPQIQTPTFDFNNIQPIMEQPQIGNNEVNNLQSTIESVQPSSIEMPTFDFNNIQPIQTQTEPQNNEIQFDSNGMILTNTQENQIPVTSPIIEQSQIQTPTFNIENLNESTPEPVQPIEPQFNSQTEQMKVPEPIIVTDYNKQYDPIMPNQQNTLEEKTPLKEVINAIRECSAKIEQYGYKIDVEEYDLATIYQVVFKVEK